MTLFYTPLDVISSIFKKVKPTADTRMVDLGSGDGRVCLYVSKHHGCECIGYEINKLLYNIAVKTHQWYGGKTIFMNEDYNTADLSLFNLIYYYPFPRNPDFEFLGFKGLIISPNFEIPQLSLTDRLQCGKWTIYFYEVP